MKFITKLIMICPQSSSWHVWIMDFEIMTQKTSFIIYILSTYTFEVMCRLSSLYTDYVQIMLHDAGGYLPSAAGSSRQARSQKTQHLPEPPEGQEAGCYRAWSKRTRCTCQPERNGKWGVSSQLSIGGLLGRMGYQVKAAHGTGWIEQDKIY